MGKERTEKCPYQSRFAGGWLCASQFLAESMVARVARKDHTELPDRFWLKEKWLKEYRLQVKHASVLLETFEAAAIIAALRTTRGRGVFSLGAKSILMPLIRAEQERLGRQAVAQEQAALAAPESPAPLPANEAPRPAFAPRSSVLSKLRDLD